MSCDPRMSRKVEGPRRMEGRGSFREKLRSIEEWYGEAFAEIGPGAANDFKHLIDGVEAFLDLLNDPETDFRVKLMDYAKTRADVAEFCRYYAKWLGEPIMERLKHEVNKVLEKAITCWDQQEVFNVMEGVL